MFCTVCRWGQFADRLLGILPVFQPEVLLPRESYIYPEPPLLHLRMLSHLQMVPAQNAIEKHAAGDAVKGANPAAVAKRTNPPLRSSLIGLTGTWIQYQSV
jgi:hypothetical protein